jgi:serine-type D-Ala-D-Ala carboxypeptidase (penicillin-binding protein 5/6)
VQKGAGRASAARAVRLRAPRSITALAAGALAVSACLAACGNGQAGHEGQATPAARASSQASHPAIAPSSPALQVAGLASEPTHVKAKGAALADPKTMQLLWSRHLDIERPIGSITKVMTALVVVRGGDLNRKVRIPKAVLNYVAKYQGESAGLHPGDVLTVRDLLAAMLLPSGCDAAYVLAMTYGPGMKAFLAKMNATARQLGMLHTHFTSPDGLPYPTEYSTYSTPADLLRLGIAAMKSQVIRSLVDLYFYHLRKKKGQHHSYWWDNTNGLIGSYRGAVGIKTGYTDAALHCLLFEAIRNGRTLIGVVLGSPATSPYAGSQAAARMLNWGFGLRLPSAG